ncbi:MAG: prepilin-type N-terminal cleavage/methylation domain-containing protein [bacterium]|nr:prepilin-type N-terminal cleavage/methylation domain-containing protein [bacterium]
MHPRGQTLIELIIAVGIIAAGLVGILTLTQASIRAWTETVRRVQATYLAAEGIELTRNAIETNELKQKPWWDGFRGDGTMTIDRDGPVDFTPNDLDECAGATCLLHQDAAGFFNHGNGVATSFARIIELRELCDGNTLIDIGARCAPGALIGIQIRSVVSFPSSGGTREQQLTERWYQWRTL